MLSCRYSAILRLSRHFFHVGSSHILEALAAIQGGMSSMQLSISERTIFLSEMTGLSIIFARRVALSPSVLCQTLRCGLPTDMILQK